MSKVSLALVRNKKMKCINSVDTPSTFGSDAVLRVMSLAQCTQFIPNLELDIVKHK